MISRTVGIDPGEVLKPVFIILEDSLSAVFSLDDVIGMIWDNDSS
jgi:hypothetical protein